MQRYRLADERQTGRWAQALAQALPSQDLERQAFIVTLRGDLGAGKTTLVRYMLRALGVQGRIKSPTFALVESYNLPKFPVYHFDLYRFSTPDQWFDAGFDDIFAGAGLMLVEWPEQAAGALPAADLDLRLLLPDPDTDETPQALLPGTTRAATPRHGRTPPRRTRTQPKPATWRPMRTVRAEHNV